jgi:hypothetical protein
LRESTRSCNIANRAKQSNNTSGYKGAYYNNKRHCWFSSIQVMGKSKYLGRFADKESAARAYDKAARKNFGEFACCNFA